MRNNSPLRKPAQGAWVSLRTKDYSGLLVPSACWKEEAEEVGTHRGHDSSSLRWVVGNALPEYIQDTSNF